MVKSLLALLLLPALLFTCVVAYTRYETTRTTAPPPGQPGALVWNDGGVIFSNTNEIAAWVRLHGSNFQAFKRNHPAAVQLVKSRPKTQTVEPQVKLAANEPAPAVVASSSSRDWTGLAALGGAATLLLLLSLMPIGTLQRLHLARGDTATDLRMITISGAAAIFAGLALALLL